MQTPAERRLVTMLDDHAGEAGFFRIKPRLRVHNEGERVHSGDPVVLEEINTGQRLMFGSPLANGSQEVISATEAGLGFSVTSFKVTRAARACNTMICNARRECACYTMRTAERRPRLEGRVHGMP